MMRMQNQNFLRQIGSVQSLAFDAKNRQPQKVSAERKLTGQVALFETDEYGFVNSWSRNAEQVYGYEPEEIIGKHVSSLYVIGDLIKGVPVLELLAVQETGRTFTFGWQKRKSGQEFWTHSECQSLADQNGKLSGYRKFVVETAKNFQ